MRPYLAFQETVCPACFHIVPATTLVCTNGNCNFRRMTAHSLLEKNTEMPNIHRTYLTGTDPNKEE
jgi:hypothetical protein